MPTAILVPVWAVGGGGSKGRSSNRFLVNADRWPAVARVASADSAVVVEVAIEVVIDVLTR